MTDIKQRAKDWLEEPMPDICMHCISGGIITDLLAEVERLEAELESQLHGDPMEFEEWWKKYDLEESSIRLTTPNRDDCETAWQASRASAMKRIAELEAELAKYTAPVSNIHSVFCALCERDYAKGACGECTVTRKQLDHVLRVEKELAECKEPERDIAHVTKEEAIIAFNTIRQQTAREICDYLSEYCCKEHYITAIKEKYGLQPIRECTEIGLSVRSTD